MPAQSRRSRKFFILNELRAALKKGVGFGTPAGVAGWLILAAGALLAVACYLYFDRVWLDFAGTWWRTTPGRQDVCSWLGVCGDFYPFNLLTFVVLLGCGRIMRSRYVMRLAVVSLLSGVLAGSVAVTAKHLLGRPRPKTVLAGKSTNANEFCGPFHGAAWASFPSGHAATSVGAAVPVLLAVPGIGVPVALIAAGISGSRVVGLYHYPSDVLAGVSLGLFFGVRCGWPLRRIRRKARSFRFDVLAPRVGRAPEDF